jgi:hypothetical protein
MAKREQHPAAVATRFQKGHVHSPEALEKIRKRSRGTLTKQFIEELAAHFEEHGRGAINIVYREEPATYLKIIASLCPKEFLIEAVNPLGDLSDDELLTTLDRVRRLKNVTPSPAPKLIEHEHVNGNGRTDA